MLRVISGKYRGRKLVEPFGENTRPTMDRIKEAIFSSIHFGLEGTIVLDLFSGSGSMAIESVSRGAMKAFAIDNDKNAMKAIKENIETLEINNIKELKSDSISFLKSMSGTKFDYIFVDPPYEKTELYNNSLNEIAKGKMLKELGNIIVETNSPRDIVIPNGLTIQKEKKYGKTTILYIANNI